MAIEGSLTSMPTPDHIVKIEVMNKKMTKFHLGGGKVLHKFTGAGDEEFHDHPWPFRSSILSGGYEEEIAELLPDGTVALAKVIRAAGTTHSNKAGTVHRILRLLTMTEEVWTLIEPGDQERKPGFYKFDDEGIWHRYWDQRYWTLQSKRVHLI